MKGNWMLRGVTAISAQCYKIYHIYIAFIFVTLSWKMLFREFINSIMNNFSGTAVMSDFIESEAEESEEEFEEKDLKPKKTQRFMEDDGKIWIFWVWMCVSELRWCEPLMCHFSTDEEEEENTEDQDEQGNLRGLIDDGDEEVEEEDEEQEKNQSGGGSDSEEEVRHRRKKRSKFI